MIHDSHAVYAGFWRRAAAFLADGLIVSTVVIPFDFGPLQFAGDWTSFIISILADWLYTAALHSSSWQATPGKRAFGIKVTTLEGRRIGFGRATARYAASILSSLLLGVGFMMAGWTRRKQALHDKVARTLVVNRAASAEEIERGGRVMPVTARLAAGIAVLAIATAAQTYALSRWTGGRGDARAATAMESANPAQEERIEYEIYRRPFLEDGWRLVSSGARTYRHAELAVSPMGGDAASSVKSLALEGGYEIQASVFPEPSVDGFGLTLRLDGGGFSWDWFDRESGDVFRKLQGPGRVRVRFAPHGADQEIAGIEFLDDVTLRLDRYWLLPFHHGDTDRVVVKKGSVFWLAD